MDKNETTNQDTSVKCAICSHTIKPDPVSGWAYGHEAYPVAVGRACDFCHSTDVLPARIMGVKNG